MQTLERIKAILGNQSGLVEVANRCDEAYCVGTNNE